MFFYFQGKKKGLDIEVKYVGEKGVKVGRYFLILHPIDKNIYKEIVILYYLFFHV